VVKTEQTHERGGVIIRPLVVVHTRSISQEMPLPVLYDLTLWSPSDAKEKKVIFFHANLTKGFMCLLKKDTPFIWDEWAQESFDSLKKALVSTPLLKPPDNSRDYLFYIAASKGMVGMVLVQEEDELHEHIVY
jgi:hypothetical protein